MTAKVALIDYGAGNLRSASKALAAVGAEVEITHDVDTIAKAERIVLPGVGAFADCMAGLLRHDGLVEVLRERVIRQAIPFLGICVGMQLMASEGHEFGITPGLDWLPGQIVRLEEERGKIPHMGWNEVVVAQAHPLFDGLAPDVYYFVHSYHFLIREAAQILGYTDYGGKIVAIAGKDNMIGTQFHPEKSGQAGLALLARFLQWRP